MFTMMALLLLQLLVSVAAAVGNASEEGSGEVLHQLELGSGEQTAESSSDFSESGEGDEVISRRRNLNRIFDVLSEINPEALFEDYKYQDINESSDLSKEYGDNDVDSNSVEWKNASSEFEESEFKGNEFEEGINTSEEVNIHLPVENATRSREERGKGKPRLRIENDVHSFFNLFPINEHVISNIVHNLTRAFQRDILGQKDETEESRQIVVTEKSNPITPSLVTVLDAKPDKIETHAPLVESESSREGGDEAEISFEHSTSTPTVPTGITQSELSTLQTETTQDPSDIEESTIQVTTKESEDVTEPLDILSANESSTIPDEQDSSEMYMEDTTALPFENFATSGTTESQAIIGEAMEEEDKLLTSYQEEHISHIDGQPCDCICDSSMRYMLPEGRNLPEDEVTIVLQDDSGNTLCSEEETHRCCTDIVFESLLEEPLSKENKPQPRFKFPCQKGWTGPDCTEREKEENKDTSTIQEEDYNDYIYVPLEEESHLFDAEEGDNNKAESGNETVVEMNISESILVDTDGIPQLCLPYLEETTTQNPTTTATSLPTVNDKIIFGTMALDEPLMEKGANETVEAKGSWVVTVHLNKTSRVKVRVASRTPISCLARRGARPSLLHFDILAAMDGTSRQPLYWNLAPGEWFIQLHNEENFDQEVVLSMAREDATGPACCKEGCRLIEGRHQCPGEECIHGEELGSRCICNEGWVGPLCNMTSLECRDSVCMSRGECLQQTGPLGFDTIICDCDPGAAGAECEEDEKGESEKKTEEEDCQCGEQGVCRDGECR